MATATVQTDPTVVWTEPTCKEPKVVATVSVPEDGQEDTFTLYDGGDPVQGQTVTVSPGSSGMMEFPVTPGGDGFALTVKDSEGSQVGRALNGGLPACEPPPCECNEKPAVKILPCCVGDETDIDVRVYNPNRGEREYKVAILHDDEVVGGPKTHTLAPGASKVYDFSTFEDGVYWVKVWDVTGDTDKLVRELKYVAECPKPSPSPSSPSPSPSGSPSTSPSASPSISPSASPSASTTPAPGGGGGYTPPSGLPLTGSKLLLISGVGLALVAAGGIALIFGRRRSEELSTEM